MTGGPGVAVREREREREREKGKMGRLCCLGRKGDWAAEVSWACGPKGREEEV
jgi:hypothetical protein